MAALGLHCSTQALPSPHIGPVNLLSGSTRPPPFSNWKVPSIPHSHVRDEYRREDSVILSCFVQDLRFLKWP